MRRIGAGVLVLILARGVVAGESDRARPDHSVRGREAESLARVIDARLEARWKQLGITPVARAQDGEFLRRVSLDLVGRIPTAAEARDFIDDPSPAKRGQVVDRLLDSPAYASRSVMLWRQLLLPSNNDGAVRVADTFDAWIARKVADGTGYDRMVREILSVKLNARDDDATSNEPSPAAYYTSRQGKPESLASDTARAFLGIRLECAQCHDHPFARWKRQEFWGYAAFFAGVPRQADDDNNNAGQMRRIDPNARELKIPGTSNIARASHLDHSAPDWRPRAETRDVLSDWVTSPKNTYFARAAVNRVWARFFGTGLVDPVDDLDSATDADPALVALLEEIARQFREHDYDMRFLTRAILATRAYNLSSQTAPGESTPPPCCARMSPRGLSPSQFIDSLSQATGLDLAGDRGRFLELFADRDTAPTESQTTILQALTMMNGSFMEKATNPATGDLIGAVADAPYLDTAGRIEILYLATLARRPTPDERSRMMAFVDRFQADEARHRALGDAFWALLNSPEFRVNH